MEERHKSSFDYTGLPATAVIRPDTRCTGELWVFAYGSLMWNPGFPYVEARMARLKGYHRRFCVCSYLYRGTKRNPGLVLGLDHGGSCSGIAYRAHLTNQKEVLDYLWRRELTSKVYRPQEVPVLMRTVDGTSRRRRALTFVVDRHHENYAGELTPERTAELINSGEGTRGRCRDYLENTVQRLKDLGIEDAPMRRLLHLVRRNPPQSNQNA